MCEGAYSSAVLWWDQLGAVLLVWLLGSVPWSFILEGSLDCSEECGSRLTSVQSG